MEQSWGYNSELSHKIITMIWNGFSTEIFMGIDLQQTDGQIVIQQMRNYTTNMVNDPTKMRIFYQQKCGEG